MWLVNGFQWTTCQKQELSKLRLATPLHAYVLSLKGMSDDRQSWLFSILDMYVWSYCVRSIGGHRSSFQWTTWWRASCMISSAHWTLIFTSPSVAADSSKAASENFVVVTRNWPSRSRTQIGSWWSVTCAGSVSRLWTSSSSSTAPYSIETRRSAATHGLQ